MSHKCPTIEDAAAEWIGKCDDGLSAGQRAEFARWIATDPRHAEAFEGMNAVSRALDRLGSLRPALITEPDNDLRLRRSRRKLVWLPVALAAAALAMFYVGRWRTPHDAELFSREVATAVGGLKRIDLPDGSVVELNTNSAVDIRFSPAERRVALVRGEARFSVAKNPARPFVVKVRQVAVRAVGTEFVIHLRRESVEVLVTEGRVRVNDNQGGASLIPPTKVQLASLAEPAELAAGQRAVISLALHAGGLAPATVAPMDRTKISQMLAWEERKLEFDPTPLGALVEEFNRYNRHKLVIADPAISGLKVGGTFRVDDYDAFVRLLESSFDIAAERLENETVLRARP